MKLVLAILVLVLIVITTLLGWRHLDAKIDEQARSTLLTKTAAADACATFDPALLAGLPEPAQRYFRYVIRPGARLATVAEIEMGGEISLGTKAKPDYQPMQVRQVLASPHGLIWSVTAGTGFLRFAGTDAMADGRSWSRFWVLGMIPVAQGGGDTDHLRSSFGRVVAEAAIWTPAALLPSTSIRWSSIDANTARATASAVGLIQSVDIRIAPDGRPLSVVMPRWSNANPARQWREQPFGGTLGEFREFDGFVLPTRVDGGNFFGSDDYFPFYRARVTAIRFPAAERNDGRPSCANSTMPEQRK